MFSVLRPVSCLRSGLRRCQICNLGQKLLRHVAQYGNFPLLNVSWALWALLSVETGTTLSGGGRRVSIATTEKVLCDECWISTLFNSRICSFGQGLNPWSPISETHSMESTLDVECWSHWPSLTLVHNSTVPTRVYLSLILTVLLYEGFFIAASKIGMTSSASATSWSCSGISIQHTRIWDGQHSPQWTYYHPLMISCIVMMFRINMIITVIKHVSEQLGKNLASTGIKAMTFVLLVRCFNSRWSSYFFPWIQ